MNINQGVETPTLTQTLYALPKLPLAEDVEADKLLAYRDSMCELGDGRPNFLACYAWNDLELGFALQDERFVDAAFDTFRELDEHPSANLAHRPFLYVRMVLASEIPLRQRLESAPMGKKKVAQAYRQAGTVIQACLEMDSIGVNGDKFADLIAYGSLARSKNADNFPYLGSPREAFGSQWPNSHSLYRVRHTADAREKDALLRIRKSVPANEPPVGENVRMAYMMPTVYQAIRSQGEVWAQGMAGNSGRRACEERWIRYIGSQLVRESQGEQLKPEAEGVLNFMTAALQGKITIATEAELEAGLKPPRAPDPQSQRHAIPIVNTALADQLRQRFNLE